MGLYKVQVTSPKGRTEEYYCLVGGQQNDLLTHEIDENEALRIATRLGAGEQPHEVFKVYRNADFEVGWTEVATANPIDRAVATANPIDRAVEQIKKILDALSKEDRATALSRITMDVQP